MNRRSFLGRFGAMAAAIPFLPALRGRAAPEKPKPLQIPRPEEIQLRLDGPGPWIIQEITDQYGFPVSFVAYEDRTSAAAHMAAFAEASQRRA